MTGSASLHRKRWRHEMTGFEYFQFLRPGWLLVSIPGCWLVIMLHQRWKKRTDWSGVVEPHLLELLLVEARGVRGTWVPWMLSLMLFLVITAMAGPVLEKRSVPVLKKIWQRCWSWMCHTRCWQKICVRTELNVLNSNYGIC